MQSVGIICDIKYPRHNLFKNYFYAVENLFGTPRFVGAIENLDGIKLLFIGDDHYETHRDVWQQEGFIDYCNDHKIKVIVLTNEKILNTCFPWNETLLERLNTFKYLYHYAIDIDDCEALGLGLLRAAVSKTFKDKLVPDPLPKIDKVVFVGTLDCIFDSYRKRRRCVEEIKNIIDIDIIDLPEPKWEGYFETIGRYRFVLSPMGNGNFFPMRFYEALAVRSIPIHQITAKSFHYYNIEATFNDCIYFEDTRELSEKIKACNITSSHSELWMEDSLEMLLKKDGIL